MAFSRNAQRASKASPQVPLKKQPKQPSSSSRVCPNPIISTIRQLPESQKDWSESMRYLLRELLQEENRSMEAMLNSSINHFTQYISQHDDMETQNHQLIRQNQRLSAAIEELRNILKQKLEAALRKQREDLNIMMQDYIQLIQKLLKDKESFAAKLEEEAQRADMAEQVVNSVAEEQLMSLEALELKDKVIQQLQRKVKQQSIIIQQNESKVQQLGKQNESLREKINHLQLQSKELLNQMSSKDSFPSTKAFSEQSRQHRDDTNNSKSKFLLQLLEQSQAEIKRLKERLRHEAQHSSKDALILELQQKIAEMEQEHEEQFNEYDQSMKEVMERKDQQIQKLAKNLENALKQQKAPSS